MLAPTATTVKTQDTYRKKAVRTRKHNDAWDKRLAAEFAERQRLFQLKLEAIIAAKKVSE